MFRTDPQKLKTKSTKRNHDNRKNLRTFPVLVGPSPPPRVTEYSVTPNFSSIEVITDV